MLGFCLIEETGSEEDLTLESMDQSVQSSDGLANGTSGDPGPSVALLDSHCLPFEGILFHPCVGIKPTRAQLAVCLNCEPLIWFPA